MKKNFLYPLSILAFLGTIFLFQSCETLGIQSLKMPNTKVIVESQLNGVAQLSGKRVLIASFDSSATRELVISLKNYMDLELTACKITSKRINIRENEAQDIADFEKLKTEFQPDYILKIQANIKRTRDFYLVGDVVKKIRDIDFHFNLSSFNAAAEQPIIWKGEAQIKHLYDEGHITTMKKTADLMRQKMQKDLIIN